MKVLLLALLSFNSLAADTCRELDLADQLQAALPQKECPKDNEAITKLVEDEYKKFYGDLPQVKREVKGYSLTGSDKELSTLNDILGATPPSSWGAAASICTTVQCALEKLFNSKEAAMQVMNIKAKTGYTLSVDQNINGGMKEQFWSPTEVREFDAAMSKIPPEIKNLGKLKNIYRQADGLRLEDHSAQVAAYAQPGNILKAGYIVSYDSGMKGTTSGKNPYQMTSWPQEAMIHEICHHHDFQSYYKGNSKMASEQTSGEWIALSDWKEKTNAKGESEWVKKPDAKFVSWYAETAPAEDYAESCMNYILHPQKLKEKAPEKYAWMKANLFNNKEYTDKVWTGPQSWPALNNLISDESACNKKLIECAKGIRLGDWASVEYQFQKDKCFADFKNKRLQEINATLMDTPEYCDKGGANLIMSDADFVCKNSLETLSSFIQPAQKFDFAPHVKACEEAKDYTGECLLKKANLLKEAPAEIAPTVSNLLMTQLPDRYAAIGKKLTETKSSEWLKACLATTSQISYYTDTGTKKTVFGYTSKAKGNVSFLGSYIYKDYNRDDGNKECAVAALNTLKDDGYKIPTGGYPVNAINETFVSELRSLETEVISQIRETVKGCADAACKSGKTLKLLQDWEAKSPKREGFASKEYADELLKKLN